MTFFDRTALPTALGQVACWRGMLRRRAWHALETSVGMIGWFGGLGDRGVRFAVAVQARAGQLWVEDRPSGGARFVLVIPNALDGQ